MVWVKSFLSAAKWVIIAAVAMYLIIGSGSTAVSMAAFSLVGFLLIFMTVTFENLGMRY